MTSRQTAVMRSVRRDGDRPRHLQKPMAAPRHPGAAPLMEAIQA
jgi:hypothetical protein